MTKERVFFYMGMIFVFSVLWVLSLSLEDVLNAGEDVKAVEDKDAHAERDESKGRHKEGEKRKREFATFQYDEKTGHYFIDVRRYRVEFLQDEMRYTPKMGNVMGKTIIFKTEGFFQGGKKLFSSDNPEVKVIDNKILAFKMKDYVQHYEVKGWGFNQGWTIKTPVKGDEDLILKASITTEYKLEPRGEQGFLIKDGENVIVDFKQLTAVDFKGQKINLKTELKCGYLEITFPADFLKKAEFPVAINPPLKMKEKMTSSAGEDEVKVKGN